MSEYAAQWAIVSTLQPAAEGLRRFAAWQVVGTGDFNGDGTTDVLVKNGGLIVDLLVQNSVATTGRRQR